MKTTSTNAASYNPAHAAALGLPATFKGFTPDDAEYWREPNLPFLSSSGVEQLKPGYGTDGLFIMRVTGGEMAPRFPVGTLVAASRIRKSGHLIGGCVYFWQWNDKRRGVSQTQFGRLVDTRNGALLLEHDQSGVQHECATHWKEEGFALYLVDYYVSLPSL